MRFRSPKWAVPVFTLALLLSACDPTGLTIATPTPVPLTPTATSAPDTPTAQPTDTVSLPTDTPQPVATATAGADIATSTPQTGAGTTPGASPTVNSALKDQLEEVEAQTSRLRGLQPKKPVPEHFISPEQLKQDLIRQMGEDYSHEEAARDAQLLWLLRLLDDPKMDLYQMQIDLLGERVLGYYDTKKHELFVRAEQSSFTPLERETLAHEFTHALQDQHFDFQKIEPDKVENDRGTAARALTEGDAVVTQEIYDQQFMTPDERTELETEKAQYPSNVADRTPLYLVDSLYFPYIVGPTFITALAQAQPGSYKGINDALADPPVSSEQILHPEKYLMAPPRHAHACNSTASDQHAGSRLDLPGLGHARRVRLRRVAEDKRGQRL